MLRQRKVSRIALPDGAVLFAEPPSPVVVVNHVGDGIFQDVMAKRAKSDILHRLCREFPETSEGVFCNYIDSAYDTYANILTKAEAPNQEQGRLTVLFDRSHWSFDEIIDVGVTGVHLEIGCDHFDSLLQANYGPAFSDGPNESQIRAHLQVVVAPDGDYWLRCDHSDIDGPYDHHHAYLEIQRHLLSNAHGSRRTELILHASVVADEAAGRSIILVGDSGSGKSSLAAELLLRGQTLVADDTAIVDADTGEIWWQRLPLRLKKGTWERLGDTILEAGWPHEAIVEEEDLTVWRVYPERSALVSGYFGPARRVMIFPIYEAGSSIEIEPIQLLTAMGLITQAGAWFNTGEAAMRRTIDWLSGTSCYSMVFSSADEAVAAIDSMSNDV